MKGKVFSVTISFVEEQPVNKNLDEFIFLNYNWVHTKWARH